MYISYTCKDRLDFYASELETFDLIQELHT